MTSIGSLDRSFRCLFGAMPLLLPASFAALGARRFALVAGGAVLPGTARFRSCAAPRA